MLTKDLYQQTTDRIVKELEQGVPPWVKPWNDRATRGLSMMPANLVTSRPYSGINTLILWSKALDTGYPSHSWATFHQALQMGANVRKGERSTHIVFVKRVEDDDGERRAFLKSYSVFNLAQLENVPEKHLAPADPLSPKATHEQAKALLTGCGVPFMHGGNRACYYPSLDKVVVPPFDQFTDEDGYWQTVNHELTHATGHKSRLDREMGKRFGSESYAGEELVAELGSAFLCARLGIPAGFQSASYLQSWIKVLKNDNRAIFTAASMAAKAAEFLWDAALGKEAEPELEAA